MSRPLILVVEDYEDAREMCLELLSFSGFRVAEARNGFEALTKTAELEPDLILMDLSLPGLDGLEVTHRIKSDRRLQHIPIVALTAYVHPSEVERARLAGCAAFLAKPYPPDELVDEIHRVLSGSSFGGRGP